MLAAFSRLLLLLSVSASPLGAAVRMDVFLGYDSVASEGSWFPVAVEVENDGPGFNGVFQFAPAQFSEGQTRAMAIELPTSTVKRFVLPVFAASRYRSTWDARIVDEKGKVRAENPGIQMRRQIQGEMPLVGAIARTGGGVPVLPEVKSKQAEWQPGVARMQPMLFPDTPIALEGLRTIYLNSEKALELKLNQVNALASWLHAGGHLVVGIDQIIHVNGNEWLKRLVPCELATLASGTNHSALQEWVRGPERYDGREYSFTDTSRTRRKDATSPPARFSNPYANLARDSQFEAAPMQVAVGTLRGAEVLIGTTENPLAITARRGRGQITALMFSPEMEPFISWNNRAHFWAKMADLPPEALVTDQYQRYQPYSIDGIFGAMIDSQQVRKLPVFWLLMLLVGYLAVIGPLDQYWLKKINRQMLTWITFPLYVVFFSGLIYLIGYRLRAGETEWNELHVVDVFPMGPQSDFRGWSFGSVYSPVNARYRLAGDHPFAALRSEYLRNQYRGGQELSKANIEQRGNSFSAEISVPVWTSQLYVSDWWRRGQAPFAFGVIPDESAWQISVTNRSETTLKNLHLFVDGRVFELGDLGPNETKPYTVRAGSGGDTIENFAMRHGGQFFHAVQQRQQAFGETRRIGDVPRSAMAASFVSFLKEGSGPYGAGSFQAPKGFDLTETADAGDAILMAWAPDHSPAKPMSQFSSRRNQRDTLFRVSVPLR